MKKRISLALACILTLSLVLTACGGNSGNSGSTAAPASGSQASASTGGDAAASGETYTLRLHHHDNQTNAMGAFYDELVETVKEKSDGRLIIEVFHGGTLGSAKDTYDMVLNGTCDIGGGLPSFFPGRFPMTEAISLPLMGVENATQGTKALWDLYNNTDYLDKEYSEVEVLLLNVCNDSPIATKSKKIESYEDFAGLKLRANAGPPTEFVQQIGAVPMSIVVGELYTSLEKSVIDGVVSDWNAFNAFKLYDQLNYYVDEKFTINPYFIIMNKNSYANLPEDLQQILKECTGGEEAVASVSSKFDQITEDAKAIITDMGGEIYTLPDADRAKLQEAADKTWDAWKSEMSGQGYPAEDVIAELQTLLDQYK